MYRLFIIFNNNASWDRFLKCLFVSTDDTVSNVISRRIFRLFPCIKRIEIGTYEYYRKDFTVYEFCLLSLLKEIAKSPPKFGDHQWQIEIQGYQRWFQHKVTRGTQQQYSDKHYRIFESTDWDGHRLFIKRKNQ